MRITLALLAITGAVAGRSIATENVKVANRAFLDKQRFVLELCYDVDYQLKFQNWIILGNSYTMNKTDYAHYDSDMKKFYEAYEYGTLLQQGGFFGAFVKTHNDQAKGLAKFFYNAKTWKIFQSMAAWARMRLNSGMFMYALTFAVGERIDCKGLILPAVYEFCPYHFYNSRFIYPAKEFDFEDVKEYKRTTANISGSYWWQGWNIVEEENADGNSFKAYKIAENTAEIEFMNEESALADFTENIAWTAQYYKFNMNRDFDMIRGSKGESLYYAQQQLMIRYNLERLSRQLRYNYQFSFKDIIQNGYKSQLVGFNDIAFSSRPNYLSVYSHKELHFANKVTQHFQGVEDAITRGFDFTADGKTIDLRKPESIEHVCNMLEGNADATPFSRDLKLWRPMYLAEVESNDVTVSNNGYLNPETFARDPIYYSIENEKEKLKAEFLSYLPPYSPDELREKDVVLQKTGKIELNTQYSINYNLVTNLGNHKVTFANGQLVWDKSLYAGQKTLKTVPFNINHKIESQRAVKGVLVTFLGPKYDRLGRKIPFKVNRKNFIEIDNVEVDLKKGVNNITRHSKNLSSIIEEQPSYRDLYEKIMLAINNEDEYHIPSTIHNPRSYIHHDLLLPSGSWHGTTMQLFTHFKSNDKSIIHPFKPSMGYPLDRKIDEPNFFQSNMLLQDIKIYHQGHLGNGNEFLTNCYTNNDNI